MTSGTARLAKAGGGLVRRFRVSLDDRTSHAGGGRHSASGWMVVTVLGATEEIQDGPLPQPLAALGDRIEVRVGRAPGDNGTELAARFKDPPPRAPAASRLAGSDPEAELRSALRRSKQLIEVGEVLVVDPAPHGERTATPGGRLLESWTRAADGGGVR